MFVVVALATITARYVLDAIVFPQRKRPESLFTFDTPQGKVNDKIERLYVVIVAKATTTN